jgi:3-hydroxyacyl-[acyl-carrier-protein] dehydratase
MVIEDLIPHRPPFLFVNQVLSVTHEQIVATYQPPVDAPFFQGHYPGNPVMPGVLLCECAFQAGALLLAWRGRVAGRSTPVLTRIRDARFRHIVRPAAPLRMEVTCTEDLQDACYLLGRVFAGDELALRVEFAVMLAEGSAAEPRT